MKRPLILVTNDDGVSAPGIAALVKALHGLGHILVVAPDGPRSGASCGITANIPICYYPSRLSVNVLNDDVEVYACSGTPADCVKLAWEIICTTPPDLLVSGINLGDNASVCVHYSGTIGAVKEGCMKAIPSVGFSLATYDPRADYTPTLPLIRQVCEEVLRDGLPQDVCLNINFPATPVINGLRRCRQSRGQWIEEFAPAHAPRDRKWFWLTGRYVNLEPEATDTDMAALADGYASVVEVKV